MVVEMSFLFFLAASNLTLDQSIFIKLKEIISAPPATAPQHWRIPGYLLYRYLTELALLEDLLHTLVDILHVALLAPNLSHRLPLLQLHLQALGF